MPESVDWEAIERSPEFRELIARRRRFVLPATIFFLAWYLGFILLAGYAEDFMGSSIYEGFTVGYVLALTPVRDGLGPGGLVPAQGRSRVRPARARGRRAGRARAAHRRRRRRRSASPRQPATSPEVRVMTALPLAADVNELALDDLRVRRRHHARHHLLGLQADPLGHDVLGRGPRHHRRPERVRHRRRLHVRGVVPRHRGADLPVRLRRLPVLRRLPGRVPDRAVPARRAHAQRGQVHDRRRAGVPPQPAAGARRGRARDAVGRRLLPDRADGRRGRAHPGARGHRLHPGGDPHRRFMLCYVVFGGMLATTWVQIIKAVLLMSATIVLSLFVLGKVGFNPIELFNRAADESEAGEGLPGARAVLHAADRHRVARPRARARHRRPAAHPHALLHGARRQGGARQRDVGGRA